MALGCGGTEHVGALVRLSGSWNGWAKGERAPTLTWEEGAYRGVVELPGDILQFRIYAPYSDLLIGAASEERYKIPGTLSVGPPEPAPALKVATPLAARYEVVYKPGAATLHIDFASDAEKGQSKPAAALITALRGSDEISQQEKVQRAAELTRLFETEKIATPLQVGDKETAGVTFLHFGKVDSADLSVVGNFNDWTVGADPLDLVLDETVAYRGRVVSGARLEYRVALHGMRYRDPKNAEVVWDGAYLPSNLKNILGGNVGEFNSVGQSPGYVEKRSRLLAHKVKGREVYVYVPPGYDTSGMLYPTLYVHDGKDAIVRGRYNQVLDQLIADVKIPALVAVFIPAQSDADQRLSEYSHEKDRFFADIVPKGAEYEAYLRNDVLKEIEGSYRVRKEPASRALLGIDMAGAMSFRIAWSDRGQTFRRVGSQSGRFGWGAPLNQTNSPYTDLFKVDLSMEMERVSFDWSEGDQFQVHPVHDVIMPMFTSNARWAGKANFLKQKMPVGPSPTVWDNWRERLNTTLTFLFK